MQAISGETYEFQAKPQVVKHQKAKYREVNNNNLELDEAASGLPTNIMFNKKVVRGNTYAASVLQKNKDKKDSKIFKKPIIKSVTTQEKQPTQYANASTPRPLQGRHNIEIQTEEYVETLADKPPEQEIEAQTDFYIDKPPERLFKPRKFGVDKETQVLDGELFDFDIEVAPILQVLMNKTLEQARMEVLEEEELKLMKEQQRQYEKIRNAELAEMQRLETVQRRQDNDEQRRRLQYQTERNQAVFSHQKLISRLIAKKTLQNLKSNTFQILEDVGVFRNPLTISLYDDFLPWLYGNVQNILVSEHSVHQQYQGFIEEVAAQSMTAHEKSLHQEKQRKQDILDEREQKIRDKEEKKRQKIEAQRFAEEQAELHDWMDQFLNQVVANVEAQK